MPRHRTRTRAGAALAGVVLPALLILATAPAAAAEERVVLDVLRIVDGEYLVETVTVAAPDAAATEAALEARAEVVDAGRAVTYRPQGTPDPYWDEDDPQAVSSVRDVWTRTRGAGQVVAVLDTGVDGSHPDLAGALVPGTDAVGGAGDPWHGTGVAGIIAARADNGTGSAGMAPEARIMPVRVCNDAQGCPSAAIARGVLWAADRGADVINMSLGGPSFSDVVAGAIRYALDKNIPVVASSGNDGLNGNPVTYPAANSGVIAVSATTPAGAPADWAVHGWQADLATVGEDVLLTMSGGEYASGSGTSFSSPAVAGAVALLRASHPGIGVEQVQAALQAGADSSGSWNRAWGAGRLDVPAAMAAADRGGTAVTVTPSAQQLAVGWPAVAGATSYSVRVDGVERAVVAGTSTTISGLVDGNQVAVDVQPNNGARSRALLATVGPAGPAAPTLHAASYGGTSSSASVNLTASVAGAPAGRYALVRDGVSIGTYTFTLSSTPRTVSLLIGAMPTTETSWQLRGVDGLGRTGPLSNAVVAGSGRPAPPGAVTGLAGHADGTDVLLTWDEAGPTHTYRVSVADTVVATPRTGGVALEAPAGVARTYDVVAVDSWGQAGPAASVAVTAGEATRPAAPTAVTAEPGDGSVTVSWTEAAANGSPVTGYLVTASPGGATAATTGATTVTVTGLTNGTGYTFTVNATNAVGTGPASAASGVVVPGVSGAAAIAAAYEAAGGSAGPLGARVGSAYPTAGDGLTQAYTSGRIHWSAGTGAHAVYGDISRAYDPLRGESGVLGYPVGGRYATANGGFTQAFQFGRIHFSAGTGAHAVVAPVAATYDSLRGESGRLGYPLGPARPVAGGVEQAFERGRILVTGGPPQVVYS